MTVIETPFEGLLVLEPTVWKDDRGYFFESFSQQKLEAKGIDYTWVQDNEARSSKGVLRGLHFQKGSAAQAKLVRVTRGEVLDVVVDVRPDSKTFGQTYQILLSDENKKQLLVPRGFAHGYLTMSEVTVFNYKCDNYYNKDAEGGLCFDDESLKIDWGVSVDQLLIAEKDMEHPAFEDQDFSKYW